MNDTLDTRTEELVAEIVRYLAAVDVVRAEGHEPIWRPELVAAPTPVAPASLRPAPASAH
jgi:hypothetical protein